MSTDEDRCTKYRGARGAMVCGNHVNQSPWPEGLSDRRGVNWEALYPKFVKMIAAGEEIPNFYPAG